MKRQLMTEPSKIELKNSEKLGVFFHFLATCLVWLGLYKQRLMQLTTGCYVIMSQNDVIEWTAEPF